MSLGIAVQLLESGFRPSFTTFDHYISRFSLKIYDKHSLLCKHLYIFYSKKAPSLSEELLQSKAEQLIGLKVNQQREKESSKQP